MTQKATKPSDGWTLLPAAPGACQTCATEHPPNAPHNLQSLYYGVRFKGLHGRDPTWFDCFAHLNVPMEPCIEAVNSVLKANGRPLISMADFPPDGAIAELHDGTLVGVVKSNGDFLRE